MAGKIAMPFLSPYVSSKFALEGFCDSLRRELNQFRVKTVLFEPGGIATPIWTKAKLQDISFADKKYLESLNLFEKNFIDLGINGFPVELAAKQMFRIIIKKHLNNRYIIDRNPLITFVSKIIPEPLIDKFTEKIFGMKK